MQQPTLPGCLHEIAPEPRGPGGWLHPDGDEAQVLIRDDCEPEPPLSRLNGMTLRLPVVPLALLRPLWHLRWIMIMSVCAGVTWVPMCLSALVVLSLLALGTVLTVSVDAHSRAKAQLSAKFLVVGDWGREGGMNQTEVARAMARVASVDKPDFVISTGDNFYESGLTSVNDAQLNTSFSNVYGAASLQGIPWHAVLGNHDYGELWRNESAMPQPPQCSPGLSQAECHYGPLHQRAAQLDVRVAERDARWHCERWFSLSLLRGAAEVFFIDTSPGVLDYRAAPWAVNPGGILSQSWEAQLLELEARLAASSAHMKLVVGHHPVRSRRQGEDPEIRRALQPLLERYDVAAYLCGHEHNLQHLHADGETTHYIVSGGGSKTDYHQHPPAQAEQRLFVQGSGFVACELTERALSCQYYGIGADTTALYSVSIEH